MNLGRYSKFIVALVGLVVAIAVQRFGAGNQTLRSVIELLTALGVYSVPNTK